jgi:hypothetical protein
MTAERMSLTRPAPPTALIPYLSQVWLAFMTALNRKATLYGWDRIRIKAWGTEAGRELGRLLGAPARGVAR